jgi:hypothetical protein
MFGGEQMKELIEIQKELKAPKSQRNTFGNYNYRSCEDILEAVKPLCHKHGCLLTISDSISEIGGRVYVSATATITSPTNTPISVTAYAREPESKKGMDASQITGAASSYARKYALNGLFCIDDTKDADTMDNRPMGTHKAPTQNNSDSNLVAKAESVIDGNNWPDAKKQAMKKNLSDPVFCQNVIEGKIK